MRLTTRQDWYQRVGGLVAAAACVTGAIWALISAVSTHDAQGRLGYLGFLVSMVPLGVGATRLLKAAGEVDVARASRKLAAAVETGELAQRTQLLGGDNQPIDVGFCFRSVPSRGAEGAAASGSLGESTDYYRRLRPQRLVITGAPGSGKTVLALELMLGLLENREPGDPVPVRLALAGWDTAQPLEDWLAGELVDTYRLSRATARALVKQRCVLPVLDGLDEMEPSGGPSASSSAAAAALAGLNAYQAGRGKAPLVLTCRTEEYDALANRARLLDAVRVEVQDVTPVQARAFVAARVWDPTPWSPVLDALDSDPRGTTAQALCTPWLLTLAVTAYQANGDPAELLTPDSPHALREHLLDRFIPAAIDLHVRAGNPSYQPEKVQKWLTNLACYLNDNARTHRTMGKHLLSSTDLELHRIWPIAGNRARVLDITMCAILGLYLFEVGSSFRTFDPSIPFTNGVLAALLICCWLFITSRTAWPAPKGVDLRRLRTARGLRTLTAPVLFGLSAAFAFAVPQALLAPTPRITDLGWVLPPYLSIGFVGGMAFGLRVNLETSAPRGTVEDPRDPIRGDISAGCMLGFTIALATTLTDSIYNFTPASKTLWNDIAWAPLFSLVAGFIWAGAWRRYLAILLCTRGRLPWRLGRFLDWAYAAGIMRVSGTAYQFRHRQLQNHLAPVPHYRWRVREGRS
ncbi:NACHT domain-containing protein [Streptomyces mirabilis]|uniref:NACHT domain-containing protein n=1 Tax=Streptomyces mirabilis TaxID=68239 RepID=UPI00367A64EC